MNSSDLARMIITGGDGTIARSFQTGIRLSRSALDTCSKYSVDEAFEKYSPTAVIHLAGTDIRQSESDPRTALATNIAGTRNIAERSKLAKIPLVFISSGAVFNGPPDSVFNEDAAPDPQNIYGWTKLLAELLLRQTSEDVLIVRTGWVFGRSDTGRPNFVHRMAELARSGQNLVATTDQHGSPVYVNDLVQKICDLLIGDVRGIRHIVNSESATGLAIASEIRDYYNSSSEITPASIYNRKPEDPPRSASETLVSNFGKLRSWRMALNEFLSDNFPAVAK